jgi:malonyl-CoA O-methyltransferase
MARADLRFSDSVERCFRGSAAAYERGATLQAAVAQRLGRLSEALLAAPPPAGPRADLGAGTGLLASAIEARIGGPPLLRVDACEALLNQETPRQAPAPRLRWDLNQGLPQELQAAALLASSFALQWLEQPAAQLGHWCKALRPGGALLLAVPCDGSFALWHQSAAQAAVPCTALPLPKAAELIHQAEQSLELLHCRQLRFSRANPGARAFLQQIKGIGAHASRAPRLQPGQLRRLIHHWPGPEQAIVWHVLVLVGRKR